MAPWHCYDGCYSTTNFDRRTCCGSPLYPLRKEVVPVPGPQCETMDLVRKKWVETCDPEATNMIHPKFKKKS